MRVLLASPALWLMLVILSLLVGYSFIQAVDLFSQASRTALSHPALAAGMTPLQGVFVPTFGAYYLVETLLLPFVAIRLAGQDQQNGTLKLLLQLPLSPWSLNAVKLLALGLVWPIVLLPGVSALLIWVWLGGAVYAPEILALLLGHSLYALTILCIALFATVVSNSLPTAAMLCLAATLGSWVLDFAAADGGWLAWLSGWSLTGLLRQFEDGLFSSKALVALLTLSLLFFISASILLHPGHGLRQKARQLGWMLAALLLVAAPLMRMPVYQDLTESHKHSVNPADERALRQMDKALTITVHLAADDGRRYDLEHGVLAKIRRLTPNLTLVYPATGTIGLFAASGKDDYGLIEYDYAGRHDQSYSTSPHEILPLLHALAGQRVTPDVMPAYQGHPLVADASWSRWWFYLILPSLLLWAAYAFGPVRFSVTSLKRSLP